MKAKGFCDPRFTSAKTAFESLWNDIEVGGAFSVYWQGEIVVDLWGGYQDRAQQLPWQQDTLVNVYSVTKGIVATAIAILVDQGKIDLQTNVSEYWPEFAQNGKQDITVAQLLSHQAGISGVEAVLTVENLYDWPAMIALLEAQEPLWPPGKFAGYHSISWGYLAGELIHRITGLMPGQFIQEHICRPLQLNLFLGLSQSEIDNCAELIGPNHVKRQHTQKASKTLLNTNQDTQLNDRTDEIGIAKEELDRLFKITQLNPVISPFKHASSEAWRTAQIPASNGHSDARSLAKLYGILANGGMINGSSKQEPFLTQRAIKTSTKVAVHDQIDLIMGHLIRRSQAGFILSDGKNYGFGKNSFGHAGAGGSMAFADPDSGIGFAYVMNQMQPEGYPSRYKPLMESIYSILSNI